MQLLTPVVTQRFVVFYVMYSRRRDEVLQRAIGPDIVSKYTFAIDRHQRQKPLTIPKLLLNSLMIIGHCRKHLNKSYTAALKCVPSRSFLYNSISKYVQCFSLNKISIIRSSFPSGSCSNVLTPANTREVLHNPSHVTDAEVCRLFLSAPSKSSA